LIGWVAIDREGRTSLPGLLAAGEVTSSGLHGANRLASNSLLEGLVYGARCGAVASAEALSMGDQFRVPELAHPRGRVTGEGLDLADIRNSLRSLMWRSVGVERSGAALAEAAETVEAWCRYVLPRQFSDPQGWQLQNMLEVARLMVRAAMARQETRGVHCRSDHPRPLDRWRRHIAWQRDRDEEIPETLPGAAVPA